MIRRDLSACPWTLEGETPLGPVCVPASVPGCVHADLEKAGIVPALDRGDGEQRTAWIGRIDWRYRLQLEIERDLLRHERIDLACARLDTVASIAVNGCPHGRVANEHHPHRFDLRWSLRPGVNELVIDLDAPLTTVEEIARREGRRPVNGNWGAFPYLRKAACDFGWDWGPRVRSSGVTGPVHLEAWTGARIVAIRPLVLRADAIRAEVDVRVDLERTPGAEGMVRARLCGVAAEAPLAESVALRLDIPRPELWWPRDLGAAVLHALEVDLEGEGQPSGSGSERCTVGLRTVALDTAVDGRGSAFRVVVNGRPMFCRGANIVPPGALPTENPARDEALVAEACAANMNMLRVWGGGRYASDAFYDACDRAGMLVWQDFMLACAAYPEEAPFPQRLEREARHQVARLSRHPAVTLWCGGNEIEVAVRCWEDFGARLAPGLPWGRRYLHDDFPRIVAEVDPTRPYWPDSPWSGALERDPNDPDHGDRHTWDHAFEAYRGVVPRFASEFGQQSPSCRATISEALGCVPGAFDDPALTARQRAIGGNERWYGVPLRERFDVPRDFDGVHWLAQLLQARAMWIACTWLRVHREACGGALLWQLNDVWTGHSWSLLDVALRRKPAWHAVRRAFAPRLACWHAEADKPPILHLVNAASSPWDVACRFRRMTTDGGVVASHEVPVTVPARGVRHLDDVPPAMTGATDPQRELLVFDAAGQRDTWVFVPDRELDIPRPRAAVRVSAGPNGDSTITVRARTLLRELTVLPDELGPEARTASGLVTLLPGEEHAFVVESVGAPDRDRALAALRTADGCPQAG